MSKYIIEIAEEYEEYFKGVLICGIADGKFAVDVIAREDLEELNSDYINEHFGSLQDEAYKRGLEDGKKRTGRGCKGCKWESQRGYDEPCKHCCNAYLDQYAPMPKQDDRIEVGDKVIVPSNSHIEPGELLSIVNGVCYIMWEDKTVSGYEISGVRRCTE